jgi:hypothetical protein
MKPILTTLTAATALVGAGLSAPAPASANPIVIAPLAAAAIVGGAAVGGAALGAAATHPGPAVGGPVPVPAAPAAYYGYSGQVGTSYGGEPVPAYGATAPGHGVYGTAPCYFTNARIGGFWHRVQVCD